MSAIACKIILCSTQAQAVSQAAESLSSELEQNPNLANKLIYAEEKYCAEMNSILLELQTS